MTKNLIAALGVALLMGATTSAQPIHGHPQKAFYASPAEWPKISSQCHWFEGVLPEAAPDGSNSQDIINAFLMEHTSHTHVNIKAPIYSEITGQLRAEFEIMAYQTAGVVSASIDRQETVTKIEWDDTGSTEAPIMRGSPASHALMMWTGHLTYDPRRNVGGHGFPDRGWYSPQFEVITRFDSSAETLQLMRLPFYSMLDPNAPDGSLTGAPLLISSCYPHSASTDEWGTNYVEVDTYLPLLPISAPWRLAVGTASYGGRSLGDGLFDERIDLDLHHDVRGISLSLQPESGFNGADRAPVFDPVAMGSGLHKAALIWSKPLIDNREIVSALLVFDVTVGAGVPPPPPPLTCDDPKASNRGGPLPCVFAPPPPPDPVLSWQAIGSTTWIIRLEREIETLTGVPTGRVRTCIGSVCQP